MRGGDFKAHGGFRVEGDQNDGVNVRAPLAAKLEGAGRYIEIDEVQYLFDFTATCGLDYRFDHLRKLSPKLQTIADKLPLPVDGNSNTHRVRPAVSIEAGEIIATGVGFKDGQHGPNVHLTSGCMTGESRMKFLVCPGGLLLISSSRIGKLSMPFVGLIYYRLKI